MSEKYRFRLVGWPSNVGHPFAPLNGKRPDEAGGSGITGGMGSGSVGAGMCGDAGLSRVGRSGKTSVGWSGDGFSSSSGVEDVGGSLEWELPSSSESIRLVRGEFQ